MNNKWIYDKVNSLINKYKTRDPDELIKALNIKLKYMKPTTTLLGAYSVILKNRIILLPENVGELRKMILAHELGHDQLHREYCINGMTFHENKIFSPINRFEQEANIFAAHLLIPNEDVISLIKYAESDITLSEALGVDINLLNLKISEMAKMKLLSIDESKISKPISTFLEKYRPEVHI